MLLHHFELLQAINVAQPDLAAQNIAAGGCGGDPYYGLTIPPNVDETVGGAAATVTWHYNSESDSGNCYCGGSPCTLRCTCGTAGV